MSWVDADFDWDVFVSYAHGTPVRGQDETNLKAWTKAFVKALEEDLNHAKNGLNVGSPVEDNSSIKIWYDLYDIDGNDHLTSQIKSGLSKSALLVVVMSPEYLDSLWCSNERDWFEQELRRRNEGIRNIFVVKALPTSPGDWPNLLTDEQNKNVFGFPFYPEDQHPTIARPFGYPVPSDGKILEERFHKALPNLTSKMVAQLNEIGSRNPETEPDYPDSQKLGPIYLAPGTAQQKTREYIRDKLRQNGVLVVPDRQMTIDQLSPEQVDIEIGEAMAFAQVLGADPYPSKTWSKYEPEIVRCVVASQYEKALKSDIPCFTYFKKLLMEVIEDEEHRAFVGHIADNLTDDADQIVNDLIVAISELDVPKKRPAAFMHCPRGADAAFDDAKNSIEENSNCRVRPPKHLDVNPTLKQVMNDTESRLGMYKFCDGVLFLNLDPEPENWLRPQLELLEDDRKLVDDPQRLKGLILDNTKTAHGVEAIVENITVIDWPSNPKMVGDWLHGQL